MAQIRAWVLKRLAAQHMNHATATNLQTAAIAYARYSSMDNQIALLLAACRFGNVVRASDPVLRDRRVED